MCEVVSKTLLFKKQQHCFPQKPIVFPKTHSFPTCALFYPIVLKRKIITGQDNLVFYWPGKQVFYLIDESECGRKDANTVASMVHHFCKHHGHGEKHAAIHFDNCFG